ncbi:hypothetical protein [Sphingomonas sp.]|uniref:hypothetical protein n=1 Tax=Sphingomonas sp. TaxID=28214 RepID=UPI0025FD35EE|nr:hypothetical protein [Sphingomonas sp.]MBV9527359.1 hypothetical protein [Sphingomonas sp.]
MAMLVPIVELLAGAALVLMTLRDVFDTVVVPGGSRTSLHVARRLLRVMLPLWRWLRPGKGISTTFAPVLLVASFVTWAMLMVLGFGMMCDALGDRFDPPVRSLFEAIYLAGSSMVTLGPSNTVALGAGRWVILAAGFCGLGAITLAVTYLLEIQSSVSRRDVGIYKLNTSAGDPPSALTLLETYAVLGCEGEVPAILGQTRDWCTTVRQSHASHPSLIYFRSTGTGAGWPAALGALLDLSLIVSRLIDEDHWRGPSLLLRAEGLRMSAELARLSRLEPAEDEASEEDVAEVRRRLGDAGYRLREDVDVSAMLRERRTNMACVKAMADHLGKPCAPFLPPPSAA